MEKRMDELCVLKLDQPWPEGGWRVSLLWNELKDKVPVNKEDCIRRFLQTERAIVKSPSALASFNEHVAKCLKLGYFVLEKDFGESLEGRQVSYLPFSYALKDTVADQGVDDNQMLQQKPSQDGKTKARPVSDGSLKATIQTPSVNEALVPLPDLWTGKIQNLLIQFRTANRLAMADIKLPRVPNISTWNPDLPSRRHMVSLLPLVDDIDEPVVGGMKGKGGERFVQQLPDVASCQISWRLATSGRGVGVVILKPPLGNLPHQ